MPKYDGATICLNGHVISKSISHAQQFCSICGKESFSQCPNCQAPIRGLIQIEGVAILGHRSYTRPNYCYACGAAYPWTEQILANALELLSLDEDLDEDSKNLIKCAIPDLIVDSPSMPVAAAKYQKGLARAGDVLKNSLYNLLIDVLSDAAKKVLFPQL